MQTRLRSVCPAIDLVVFSSGECGMLGDMGNKNTAKREVKKPAKPKPKAEPGRKRDAFTPAPSGPGK